MTANQIRFSMASKSTWKVLHDPVLLHIYERKWQRSCKVKNLVTLYGYIFRIVYAACKKIKV